MDSHPYRPAKRLRPGNASWLPLGQGASPATPDRLIEWHPYCVGWRIGGTWGALVALATNDASHHSRCMAAEIGLLPVALGVVPSEQQLEAQVATYAQT